MTIEEAKKNYLALCAKAGRQKTRFDYYHAAGEAMGYMEAIKHFFGPTEALKIVSYAERINATIMGIPRFNNKNLEHAA